VVDLRSSAFICGPTLFPDERWNSNQPLMNADERKYIGGQLPPAGAAAALRMTVEVDWG
jgi:hypothetical protein